MRQIALAAFLTVLVASSPAASAADVRIPLTVTEPNGMPNSYGFVSNGVPLLAGQVPDAAALRLLDSGGRQIPAQFRPLARWWNKDNSLRWVLVDFRTAVHGFGTRQFTLTTGPGARLDSPLKVAQTDGEIVVTTGVARFVINRKRFNLFDSVRLDLNGDGKYEQHEECVSPNPEAGSVIEDTYAQRYFSGEGTERVIVEEAGPVRVCVFAKGIHRARGGRGYSRGMYGYDVRVHFHAGSGVVRLDPVIHNCLAKPIGSPVFEDHSLVTRLNLTPEPLPFDKEHAKVLWVRVYGQAPLDRALLPAESVLLYQDSNGSETWKVNPGVKSRNQHALSSFRGYRISLKNAGQESVLAAGDHARGLVSIGGKRFGIVVIPRYFWQQFPKAIEVGYDGTIRVGILPREYGSAHWLQDAAGCGQELWLYFYGRGLAGKARPQFARDNRTKSDKYRGLMRDRPKPHVIADMLISRLTALCPGAHYAACGALADIGAYLPIRQARGFPLAVTQRRYFMTDYLKGNAYGWQVFGCRWEEHAGHTPSNYEPILSSDYLFRFINSRHPSWLEFGLRRNMHFRNVRAYKIDGTDVFGHTSWKDFAQSNVWEGNWAKRPAVAGEEIGKYNQGRSDRVGWYLPDPAHICLDELYDLYCLFGDTRALEGARNVAAAGGAYAAFRRAGIDRLNGWSLRALMRYYDLTGSKECLPYVRKATDAFWQIARRHRHAAIIPPKRPGSSYEGWFMDIVGRAVILAYNVTGDERMRDLAIGMTKGRAAAKLRYPTLNAFTYDQTGLAQYRYSDPDRFARYRVGAITQAHSQNYFPACDGYLWAKPRPDREAPSAISDLSARPGKPGQVEIRWTAPGDDGAKGTAAIYQLKLAELPIVETAKGKQEVNFWAAENASAEPVPSKTGTGEQLLLKGLAPGTYYFAIKSRDELNNESPISNVCKAEVR